MTVRKSFAVATKKKEKDASLLIRWWPWPIFIAFLRYIQFIEYNYIIHFLIFILMCITGSFKSHMSLSDEFMFM